MGNGHFLSKILTFILFRVKLSNTKHFLHQDENMSDPKKPANHFGLYLHNFLDRTNYTIYRFSKLTGVDTHHLKKYIYGTSKPLPPKILGIIGGMSQITGLPQSFFLRRIFNAFESDVNGVPYPPPVRSFNDSLD